MRVCVCVCVRECECACVRVRCLWGSAVDPRSIEWKTIERKWDSLDRNCTKKPLRDEEPYYCC